MSVFGNERGSGLVRVSGLSWGSGVVCVLGSVWMFGPTMGNVARSEPPSSASEAKALPAHDDPLVRVRSADPLELARVVDRIGDEAVLARLRSGPPVVRWSAIRSTPWMAAPESALASLAKIGAGRDPLLAPEAMRSVYRISVQLEPDELDAREFARSELRPVIRRLRALSNESTARRDLRRLARFARDALVELVDGHAQTVTPGA